MQNGQEDVSMEEKLWWPDPEEEEAMREREAEQRSLEAGGGASLSTVLLEEGVEERLWRLEARLRRQMAIMQKKAKEEFTQLVQKAVEAQRVSHLREYHKKRAPAKKKAPVARKLDFSTLHAGPGSCEVPACAGNDPIVRLSSAPPPAAPLSVSDVAMMSWERASQASGLPSLTLGEISSPTQPLELKLSQLRQPDLPCPRLEKTETYPAEESL